MAETELTEYERQRIISEIERSESTAGRVLDNGRFRPANELKPIHSINAKDLLNEYIAPLEYLVDKIIPAVGLAMLGAP